MGIHYHGDRSWTDRPRRAWRVVGASAALAALALLSVGTTVGSAAATCTSTGFVRDNIDLTAAMINPTGTVSGTIDATGCNIGIYYDSSATGVRTVKKAEVFGANYFGIVNNGADVIIKKSVVHDIGENPLNGAQHGNAIYFAPGSSSTGAIQANTVYRYQKNGITVNGDAGNVPITGNSVVGQGPVDYIAQNGIEVGDGAKATVTNNIVSGNSYTGSGGASSGGIIVVGGPCFGTPDVTGIKIQSNHLNGNDVGIFVAEPANDCVSASPTATNLTINKNIIQNNAVNNTSGDGPGAGYQAGVSDDGNGDKIQSNQICGAGYTPVSPPPFLYRIDDSDAVNVHVAHNGSSC